MEINCSAPTFLCGWYSVVVMMFTLSVLRTATRILDRNWKTSSSSRNARIPKSATLCFKQIPAITVAFDLLVGMAIIKLVCLSATTITSSLLCSVLRRGPNMCLTIYSRRLSGKTVEAAFVSIDLHGVVHISRNQGPWHKHYRQCEALKLFAHEIVQW